MARLGPGTELRDALNVLAADRRELTLKLRTEQPLRKPTTRAQKKAVRLLRSEVEAQIEEQLARSARRAFRGRIAVELRVRLPEGQDVPDLPKMVKAYVDVLIGPVVKDDSRIDHLLVIAETADDGMVDVTVRCLPLSIFESEFDRAFRLLSAGEVVSTVTPDGKEDPQTPFLDAAPNPNWRWGLTTFGRDDESDLAYEENLRGLIVDLNEREDEQLAEDEEAWVDLDIPAAFPEFESREVRESTLHFLDGQIAFARGRWLADQGFDTRDRPGTFPEWVTEATNLDEADVVFQQDRGPGCFVLAPPPVRKQAIPGQWIESVVQEFASRVDYGRWSGARFADDLALDIAMRGTAGKRNDVDNLARDVIGALSRAFSRGEVPRVRGYRVYRQGGETNDVRVRLLPKIRLEALARSMDKAREVARRERGERAKLATSETD